MKKEKGFISIEILIIIVLLIVSVAGYTYNKTTQVKNAPTTTIPEAEEPNNTKRQQPIETPPANEPTVDISVSNYEDNDPSVRTVLNKTITWSSTGMTSCFADSYTEKGKVIYGWEILGFPWYGNKTISGSEHIQVAPNITKLSITCRGPHGSKSASAVPWPIYVW